jgi:hypothetical protein
MSKNKYLATIDNYTTPYELWGHAINYTRIDGEGKMWVGNDEYESQVNFCPMTGVEAPVKLKLVKETIIRNEGIITKIHKKYTNE